MIIPGLSLFLGGLKWRLTMITGCLPQQVTTEGTYLARDLKVYHIKRDLKVYIYRGRLIGILYKERLKGIYL